MFVVAAEEQGVAPAALQGTIQNDILKVRRAKGGCSSTVLWVGEAPRWCFTASVLTAATFCRCVRRTTCEASNWGGGRTPWQRTPLRRPSFTRTHGSKHIPLLHGLYTMPHNFYVTNANTLPPTPSLCSSPTHRSSWCGTPTFTGPTPPCASWVRGEGPPRRAGRAGPLHVRASAAAAAPHVHAPGSPLPRRFPRRRCQVQATFSPTLPPTSQGSTQSQFRATTCRRAGGGLLGARGGYRGTAGAARCCSQGLRCRRSRTCTLPA